MLISARGRIDLPGSARARRTFGISLLDFALIGQFCDPLVFTGLRPGPPVILHVTAAVNVLKDWGIILCY